MRCSAPGCRREARYVAAQLCSGHYARRRRGVPLEGAIARPGRPPRPKPLVIVPVRLTPDALARLDELATASGVSRSAALTALVAGLFRPEPW